METLTPALRASYAHCEAVAAREARSFYLSFRLLPAERRRAMCAAYAAMRRTDDLADSAEPVEARLRHLANWREELDRAFAGDTRSDPALPALRHTVGCFGIEPRLFGLLMEGATWDLTRTRYATYSELEGYCYRVAGVVGIVCLRIWGASDQTRADALAEDCGLAFQLTNILRDVGEDLERGRIYLPVEAMERCGVTEAALMARAPSEPVLKLLAEVAERAEAAYRRAAPLVELVEPRSRVGFVVMYRTYRALLQRVRAKPGSVLTTRAAVPMAAKLAIVARAVVEARLPGGPRLRG